MSVVMDMDKDNGQLLDYPCIMLLDNDVWLGQIDISATIPSMDNKPQALGRWILFIRSLVIWCFTKGE